MKQLLKQIILLSVFVVAAFIAFSQKAKDNDQSFSPAASTSYILNRYASLASTASAGATSITVNNIANLRGDSVFTNSYNPYTTAAISTNDIVMIIQMQGASITTTDDATYGTITNYNNVGNYELKTVLSVSGNTITFCAPLSKSYTAGSTGRAQVIRIPRINNLTVGANAILTATTWDGATGGIAAFEVNGNAVVNGTINVTGLGFRGGVDPDKNATSPAGGTPVTLFRTTATNTAAGKGESIAGNVTDYALLGGANGRGAPANGGGGGNGHNAGGGGGANVGNSNSLTPWDGTGIKSVSTANWANAWNLESAGFATSISRGGGRGGYTYGAADMDALTIAPGNSSWGGDMRQNVGGLGGHPLDLSSYSSIFMGGGGGAGDENNNVGGDGGNGGGIIYMFVKGTIGGTGSLQANGNAGGNTTGANNDAPGGGGGAGAIIALSYSSITGISINCNGGKGGDQLLTTAESEGPGGGGGGGYIYTSNFVSGSRNKNGGANGNTTSSSLTEFTPNGATSGDAGTVATGGYVDIYSCYSQINNIPAGGCTTPSSLSVAAANTIINTYYPGAASVAARGTRISVGTKRAAGSSSDIAPGDLLLVIQMQGATINSANTNSYGDGISTGDASGYLTAVAGKYDFVYAASGVVNGIIYLSTPLKNSYINSNFGADGQYRFQVVKVPEYSSLSIAASASITNAEWDGSSGGIIAANVTGTMTLNGGVAINASALGFRGGGGRKLTGASGYLTTDVVTPSTVAINGSKGEGIAGTPKYTRSLANVLVDNGAEGYPGGSYASGAPANAGGGGTDGDPAANDRNTGGGGGSNWGKGGSGGFGWSAPTSSQGGYGGAPLSSYVSSSKLVLGGGGGSGSTNDGSGTYANGFSSSGGSGGGLVFLKVGAVSGTGTINANGADGLSVNNDGGGGGGGGGSVYLYATDPAGLANVTITTKGGNGGNAWITQADNGVANDGNPEHGPGGGGGGGIICTNGPVNAASTVAGGAAGVTTTASYNYGATAGSAGTKLTSAADPVKAPKVFCDLDDDNDGIADVAENIYGIDPFIDGDNDGIPNVYDDVPFATFSAWTDVNNDGISDYWDTDLDGIINELDLDSDNDGIPDVIESYGVDTNGDGIIDNYTDANGDGLSDNAAVNGSNGLGTFDFDGDALKNYIDLDSDGDGIPDVVEAGGADVDNDGKLDNFVDVDCDGFNDAVDGDVGNDGIAENTANALLLSGPDTNGDGKADSWPNKNIDQQGLPNPYDLDSDGDGITDLVEAGLPGSNGIASGNLGSDGWSDTVDALSSLNLPNSDGVGLPDYLDIDSDNDGITDNIEAQPTGSFVVATDADTDGDGLADVYDFYNGFGGNGITPYDHDSDGIPDYRDADADNDGAPDRNEGDKRYLGLTQATIDASGDIDGDGLMDYFDVFDVRNQPAGTLFKNVSMNNMGPLGNFNGPTPSASTVQLVQSTASATNRDWRNNAILPLQIISFTATLQGETAQLTWKVQNEQQADKYLVQRSNDGTAFNTISEVKANNSNSGTYNYADDLKDFSSSLVYYRIVQLNKTGALFYTRIVSLDLNSAKDKVAFYPNPVNDVLNINVPSLSNQIAEVVISDAAGKVLVKKRYPLQKGNNILQLHEVKQLPKGTLIIQVNTTEEIFTGKVIR